ncbi:MAG: O-antigen ligase family protein [Acidobacteria bacterium]|nr:O-antigen ligase family protein [Acidobacteriota bacterium]
MQWPSNRLEIATTVLVALSTFALLFSIALCQMLLAAALLTFLLSRQPVEFPAHLGWPLLAFIAWTLLSILFSQDPLSGLLYLRKVFLFFILVLVYNAYRHHRHLWLALKGIIIAGAVAALYGIGQFIYAYLNLKRQGRPFYENYVLHQASGFMSHWLTFSGQLMMVLLLTVSLLLFCRSIRFRLLWWLCAVAMSLGILAAFTRGIWLATLAGIVYLLARFQRRLLWLLPVAVLLLYLISPSWLEKRFQSIADLQTDSSNLSRPVMLRTGWEMIRAHPWFGVGPGRVEVEFLLYKPSSLPLPKAWYGHLHNSYIQFAAERGIPCLMIWLWILFEVFRVNLSLARKPYGEAQALGHAGIAITLGIMVSGLFEFNVGDSEILMLYLFVIASSYAWVRLEQESWKVPEKKWAETNEFGLVNQPGLET